MAGVNFSETARPFPHFQLLISKFFLMIQKKKGA